jgi:cytochrome c-type biogenesis protein CcmH/NrfG
MTSRSNLLRSRTAIVAIWLAAASLSLSWNRPAWWQSPYPRFQHAEALADGGRLPEAIDEAAHALADDPTNAGYAEFKGYLELRDGRWRDAQGSFSRALTLGSERPDARLGLAEALMRQDRTADAARELAALPLAGLTVEQRFRRQSLRAMGHDYAGALDDSALLDRFARRCAGR